VHPDFWKSSPRPPVDFGAIDLPETFVLYHGPFSPQDIRRLLKVWSWAASPISALFPLVVLGAVDEDRGRMDAHLGEYGLSGTALVLPPVNPSWIPEIFHRSHALLHPAPVAPWGGPVRHALACGKPVVAIETPHADAQVGPAAYLLPAGESRRLGAALITSVVEEEVAETLAQAGYQRARGWESQHFGERLLQAYHTLKTGT
jgi:glycosyltransferase involved in cell wall biosynthesis